MTRSEKIVWIFFAATSCQLAFLQPYVVLVAGERTNLFSGVLCFLTLILAVVFRKKGTIRLKSPEFLISLALLTLATVSASFSLTPFSSACRVFALLSSGLGGFWCARLLLNTPANQRLFEKLCLVLLAGMIGLCLTGYLLAGKIDFLLNINRHPLTNTMILLSFAPLALLPGLSRPLKWLAILLLCLGYTVLCLSELISMVIIPLGLLVLCGLLRTLRLKHVVLALIPGLLIIGYFSHQILWYKLNKQNPAYRIENYFFSWNIAKQHPLLGIGLWEPRERFLKDYQITYPHNTKEQFAKNVADIVTADAQLLTFLTGLGFPFTIVYCLAVLTLLMKLIRTAFRPLPGLFIPPLALLLPLAMALAHFQVYDGLLYSQDSWFFHILLGLIPVSAVEAPKPLAGTA
jgi:hypothetical protein